MAAQGEPTDDTFRAAVAAFKRAAGDEERSAASRLLRAEIDRQAVAREVAFQREQAFLLKIYERERLELEARLKRKVEEGELASLAEQAALKICAAKADADPEEALFYAGVIASFSYAREKKDIDMEGLAESVLSVISAVRSGKPVRIRGGVGSGPQIGKSLFRVTQKQLKGLSSEIHGSLKNDGVEVPLEKLTAAIMKNVKVHKDRVSAGKKLKDFINSSVLFGTAAGLVISVSDYINKHPATSFVKTHPATTVVSTLATDVTATVVTAVTTVHPVVIEPGVGHEPIMNCRHLLLDGWFFS